MDKLTYYKSVVLDLMNDIVKSFETASNPIKVQLIVDESHGQFLLYQNDWRNERRMYGAMLHLEVTSAAKIWLHHDGTDLVIAESLLEAGVPKEDIVLGFRAPVVRPDTGFAVA
jgi:XisI protein